MTGRPVKRRQLARARRESVRLGERVDELERAGWRLRHLNEISQLLTAFETIEGSVARVIEVIARTLDVRSAMFILEVGGVPAATAFRPRGPVQQGPPAAVEHAEATYGYLVPGGVDLRRMATTTLEPLRPAESDRPGRFVLLPLVVHGRSIFGALQIEADRALDEADLVFLNTVVNQLAIAIDRHEAILARQAALAADKHEQRVLADVSSILGTSLDYRDNLAALARYLVPVLGDVCVVDERHEGGRWERLETAFVDPEKQRELGDRVKTAGAANWPPLDTAADPRRGGRIAEVGDPIADGLARDEEGASLVRAVGIRSLLAVPMRMRDGTLGRLVLATAESGRIYAAADLALAEEIGRRTAAAIDNARLYEQARLATIARDDLLAIVSHDLRNPLGVILMNLATLGNRASTGDRARYDQQLAAMRRSADRMTRLVDDLLDVAVIERGQLSIDPQPVDPARAVAEAVEAQSFAAATKSLRLVSEVRGAPERVLADAERLQQVLANLIGNALKFTPEGGTITVRAEPSPGAVAFSVADTGSGIPAAELPFVFDRYWHARQTGKLGTGLGLFIAKGIVETHGGRIGIESASGQGTTVSFTVPVAKALP